MQVTLKVKSMEKLLALLLFLPGLAIGLVMVFVDPEGITDGLLLSVINLIGTVLIIKI